MLKDIDRDIESEDQKTIAPK